MKSSTIRRSNLSKEKMAVLEALSKYKQESHDITPNVYVRPNREKELDLLWQNFKVNQKLDKSPNVYLATGFIGGVITTAIVAGLIFMSMHGVNFNMKIALPAPAVKMKSSTSYRLMKLRLKLRQMKFIPYKAEILWKAFLPDFTADIHRKELGLL